jgi:multidrug efflux pump subunit AcrB
MIKFFARHPTAANLLMALFWVIGILALPSIRRETMPDFSSSEVEIRALYPGAGAEEVEEAVCLRLEDALDGIEYVKEIRSDAREGVAAVTVKMAENGKFQTFLSDIEKAVDAIDDFPDQVEDPVITELGKTDLVLSILVSGPMSVRDLKAYCEDLKARFKEIGLSLVDIEGFSDHQLLVELSADALRRFDLSVPQVAEIVRQQNTDLPAGAIETGQRDIMIRFVDRRRSPSQLEEIVILADRKGAEVRLGDIGRVTDRFELDEDKIMMDGRRTAILRINKTKSQDTIRVADKAKAFIDEERRRQPQAELIITQDQSVILADRIDMLVTNGWQGLLLVFLTMWLFFSFRVSFWVVMGLPATFLGAFYFLPYLDLTINMLTLVGLLLGLGLMMDDAIVIAENISTHRQRGKSALQSTVDGTREVAAGVISSFITTICILGPLAFIKGEMGQVLKVIPMILILVMAVSLVEAFLILPCHLGHALHGHDPDRATGLRRRIERALAWVREQVVGKTVDVLIRWRYLFVGSVIAVFILSVGMLASGKIKMQGFPELEGDVIAARILMPQGTPLYRTEAAVDRLLEALARMNDRFKPLQPEQQNLVLNASVQFNQNADAYENGPHVATVTVDLLSAEKRSGRVDDYITVWRQEIGSIPNLISLTLTETAVGPGGRDIEIRLRGKEIGRMRQAITEVKAWFEQFEGVSNLAEDLRPGKPELRLRLRKGATTYGIKADDVAQQLRASFHGVIADEIQVGPESYEIYVRTAAKDQDSLADLEYFDVTLSDGRQIPLTTLVHWEQGQGWARVARFDGMRAITLRGDVDARVANTAELMGLFGNTFLATFNQKYPDINVTIAGETAEGQITQKSMQRALLIGMVGVFFLLSFQFRSYTEPLIVMVAIPFALIGVIWGHVLMGVELSTPSILGFIALAGIVVNDSILLVVFLKNALTKGKDLHAAAAEASRRRFRAVLLTSATTIAGLLPLLFEQSLQAQILIPLVISTAFGLMASTVLVILVIPCLYVILGDLGLLGRKTSGPEEGSLKEPAVAVISE